MKIGKPQTPKIHIPSPPKKKGAGKNQGGKNIDSSIASSAKKLSKSQNSSVSKLMSKGAGAAGASGLSAPDTDKLASIGKQISDVADTSMKLKSQVEGIETTVRDYVTEVVDTAKGPIESMRAEIEELQNRETVGDKVKEHVQDHIDQATAPKPAIHEPKPTPGERLQNAAGFAKGEAEWAGGVAKETGENLVNDAKWLVDWSQDTVAAAKHMAELIAEAPDVTRDVIEQSKAAVGTAILLVEQSKQLKSDLEDLNKDTGTSQYLKPGQLPV